MRRRERRRKPIDRDAEGIYEQSSLGKIVRPEALCNVPRWDSDDIRNLVAREFAVHFDVWNWFTLSKRYLLHDLALRQRVTATPFEKHQRAILAFCSFERAYRDTRHRDQDVARFQHVSGS
jgi:hypothetical protein